MPIVVNLDVMMAKRKMSSTEGWQPPLASRPQTSLYSEDK